jgi:hypothetical protein
LLSIRAAEAAAAVELDMIEAIPTSAAAHLRYRVVKS